MCHIWKESDDFVLISVLSHDSGDLKMIFWEDVCVVCYIKSDCKSLILCIIEYGC